MPRKKCFRYIANHPDVRIFKPMGIPVDELESVVIHTDELEAVRLSDLDGLYHEGASEKMKVSRATFGRILAEGRRKIADALINGKIVKIEEGNFELSQED